MSSASKLLLTARIARLQAHKVRRLASDLLPADDPECLLTYA